MNKTTATKSAPRNFTAAIAKQLAATVPNDTQVTLTLAELMGLLDSARTEPVAKAKPVAAAPAIPAPELPVAAPVVEDKPKTDAELIAEGKVRQVYAFAKKEANRIAPWNGKKGKESVGGKFSKEGIAAFKAAFNAKAAEMGIEKRY